MVDSKKLLLREVSEQRKDQLQRGDFTGLGVGGLEGGHVRARVEGASSG